MVGFPDAPEGWGHEQTEDVGGAIWDAITGGAEFAGDDYHTQVADLVEWGGGKVRRTARAIGVPYSTFRGWLKGVVPKHANRDKITLAHRTLIGGGADALTALAFGGATLKVNAAVLGGKNRSSPFFVGRNSWDRANQGQNMAGRLIDAYLAGASPYELGAVYGSGMIAQVGYMGELDIIDIDEFTFAPM